MTFPTTASEIPDRSAILDRLKTMMRRDLKLGSDIIIDDSMPFSGGDADIDSLDILLLVASIEKEFGIKISNADMATPLFRNVGTLLNFLCERAGGKKASATGTAPAASLNIVEQLPHRPPFRFVSRVTALEPGKSAEGVWVVTGAEDFFAGHFPGRPIVPGVLIVEALAQISGLAANLADRDGGLAQIEVRIESSVAPPAEIQLRSKVARAIGDLIQYEVEAVCGQTSVAKGSITLHWKRARAEMK